MKGVVRKRRWGSNGRTRAFDRPRKRPVSKHVDVWMDATAGAALDEAGTREQAEGAERARKYTPGEK